MIKLFIFAVLINSCAVRGQVGSFAANSHHAFCARNGNYCEDSRDCCSALCTAQRCVVNPAQTTTTTTPPSVIVNRFGEGIPSTFGSVCQPVGRSCQTGSQCCSGACFISTQKCIRNQNQTNTNEVNAPPRGQGQKEEQALCSQERQQCSSTQLCCAFLSCEKNICQDAAVHISGSETFGFHPDLTNRFNEDEFANETKPLATPAKCVEIGGKCYKELECCQGLRCHGFLHQCVT